MDHKGDGDTNYNWYAWNNPQKIGTGTGRLGNKRTSSDYSDYSIIKISQNTDKIHGDLRRLAVTQTPGENHQLMLVWKTLKGVVVIIMMIILGTIPKIDKGETDIWIKGQENWWLYTRLCIWKIT